MRDNNHHTTRHGWRLEESILLEKGTNLLSICHGDLTDHCTNVDEEVEILEIQSAILTT
jgi:hypothetical protein